MKALSIRQPWAWLIVNGHKDIENRRWSTSYRGPLLIHASKTLDAVSIPGVSIPQEYERGGIVGIAELVDVVTESDNPWFEGKYGLVLRNARPLPFTPKRGALSLFDIPESECMHA